ncbi:MAG: hypothetical protein LBR07_07745 [Puniceicoccales bacterium]|jgi:hypothetical protein|nr:hypothetical protein [Puniceicoccales bacterium]
MFSPIAHKKNGRTEKIHKNWKGVNVAADPKLPVCGRPIGNISFNGMFWGQKSNAAYGVVNLAMHFYHTFDENFARETYPYVRAVATFWEREVVPENGVYNIYNDAIHEGTVGDKNPILSLGLVRMTLQLANDMSEFLGVDENRRAKWRDVHEKLAPYPTQQREGKTVFRYTEKGRAWHRDNSLGLQHIYPAGQIGFDTEKPLLEIAKNTVLQMRRWNDFNATNSIFPAAVRVGLDAAEIWRELAAYSTRTACNGFQRGNPHGVENWSTVPNTINEMLCASNHGVIRLFAVWPRDTDAAFHTIRAEGAFLVSAKIANNTVGDVRITSEKGRPLTLQNPWHGKRVRVSVSTSATTGAEKNPEKILTGDRLHLKTTAATTYRFEPMK